ncbi:MAG: SDR family NAD(P)-dependent oxidoreductase [Alphaproteobacteria bacterium]
MAGRLEGRIALITGASQGIGAAVAERFAAEGAHVIAVARREKPLEELDDRIRAKGGTATLVPLDLTDGPAIDRLGGAIAERHGRLDILVGNAGILGAISPLGHVPPQTWDRVMEVNVTANWRLIRSLDPLLRASPSGRAIFVTSGVTQKVFPFWGAYAASKVALEMLARTYAAEVEKTNLKVNLLDPGVVRTEMRAQAMPGEDPKTLPSPQAITGRFVELASAECAVNGARLDVEIADLPA